MYQVEKVFITKRGQFEDGKKSLAVGIDTDALKGKGNFKFKLKAEPNKIYYRTKEFLKNFAANRKSYWRSHKGSMVAIFPLDIFKVKAITKTKKLTIENLGKSGVFG